MAGVKKVPGSMTNLPNDLFKLQNRRGPRTVHQPFYISIISTGILFKFCKLMTYRFLIHGITEINKTMKA